MKNLLFVLLIIISVNNVRASQYIEIKDLADTWYFNQDDHAYPYVRGNGIFPEAIHFKFNFNRFSDKYLIFEHENPFAVFIDGKLVYSTNAHQVIWNIDSLGETLDKSEVLISIFSKNHNYNQLETYVAKKSLVDQAQNEILKNAPKTKYERSDFLLIFLILLISITVIINNNNRAFQEFYSLRLMVIGRVKDDSIFKLKLFSPGNLSLFLFHSGVLAFLILLIDQYGFVSFVDKLTFSDSKIINWLFLTLIIQLSFFLKYLLIRYIGLLFDIGSVSNYYFYEYMRISMVFFIFVLIITSLSVITVPYLVQGLSNLIIYATIVFMLARFLMLFTRIGKQATFKNVHLFSYLCTTELVPIIIGVKYLIF